MKQHSILLGLLIVFPISVSAVCQETDEHGNVSYVDCANAETKDAKPVDIQPINTADPVEYSPGSSKKTQSMASKRKQAYANNQRELEAAKKALEEAKVVGEGDRQKTISGSKLTDAYLSRVAAAEERVKRAQAKLK